MSTRKAMNWPNIERDTLNALSSYPRQVTQYLNTRHFAEWICVHCQNYPTLCKRNGFTTLRGIAMVKVIRSRVVRVAKAKGWGFAAKGIVIIPPEI